jgi:hypothetical protein
MLVVLGHFGLYCGEPVFFFGLLSLRCVLVGARGLGVPPPMFDSRASLYAVNVGSLSSDPYDVNFAWTKTKGTGPLSSDRNR